MTMAFNHHISKLVFELAFPSQEAVANGQDKIESLVRHYLQEALERLLDKYDNREVITKIDQLEIDLDFIDLSTTNEEIIRTIESGIELQLSQLFNKQFHQDLHSSKQQIGGTEQTGTEQTDQKQITGNNSNNKNSSDPHHPGNGPTEHRHSSNDRNAHHLHTYKKRIGGKEMLIEQLTNASTHAEISLVVFVLKNGHLPWWVKSESSAVKLSEQIDYLRSEAESEFIAVLKKELIYMNFRKRLIQLFSEQQLRWLLSAIHDEITFTATAFEKIHFLKSAYRSTVYEQLLVTALRNNSLKDQNRYREELTETATLLQLSLSDFIQLSEKKLPDATVSETTNGRNDTELSDVNLLFDQTDEEFVDGITVQHAGLVLILPFFTSFLKALELFRNGEFASEEARHHSVYLLYYIATGSEEVPDEHHLVFEKVCCGIDVVDCLLPFKGVSVKEQEEVNHLLASVIDNWKALKSSSPGAIRNAFLRREGHLKQQEDRTWKIYIERQTIDILLDRLPWTISIVRMPGSNEILYTEWE